MTAINSVNFKGDQEQRSGGILFPAVGGAVVGGAVGLGVRGRYKANLEGVSADTFEKAMAGVTDLTDDQKSAVKTIKEHLAGNKSSEEAKEGATEAKSEAKSGAKGELKSNVSGRSLDDVFKGKDAVSREVYLSKYDSKDGVIRNLGELIDARKELAKDYSSEAAAKGRKDGRIAGHNRKQVQDVVGKAKTLQAAQAKRDAAQLALDEATALDKNTARFANDVEKAQKAVDKAQKEFDKVATHIDEASRKRLTAARNGISPIPSGDKKLTKSIDELVTDAIKHKGLPEGFKLDVDKLDLSSLDVSKVKPDSHFGQIAKDERKAVLDEIEKKAEEKVDADIAKERDAIAEKRLRASEERLASKTEAKPATAAPAAEATAEAKPVPAAEAAKPAEAAKELSRKDRITAMKKTMAESDATQRLIETRTRFAIKKEILQIKTQEAKALLERAGGFINGMATKGSVGATRNTAKAEAKLAEMDADIQLLRKAGPEGQVTREAAEEVLEKTSTKVKSAVKKAAEEVGEKAGKAGEEAKGKVATGIEDALKTLKDKLPQEFKKFNKRAMLWGAGIGLAAGVVLKWMFGGKSEADV